jgi:aryl-alcohol dehydrogenase-like predicted oxidoreductase
MMGNKKIGLGTVQWGLPYGIANQHGITSPEAVTKLLTAARSLGIETLDTASLYGKSEAVLGENDLDGFKVITKTPSFSSSRITTTGTNLLSETFYRSLNLLGVKKVYGLLIHHADNLLIPGGEKLVAEMIKLKNEDLVQKIGVSVYDGSQIDSVLKVFNPDLVQLPLNVFDQRMLESGHLELLKSLGTEIHARSAFLQGLLLMPLNDVPSFFKPIYPSLVRWNDAAREQGFTLHQAAIAFVKNIPYVDTILVGLNSFPQLNSCLDSFSSDRKFDASELACNDRIFVNPSLWKLNCPP